jgi:hypothetical protein
MVSEEKRLHKALKKELRDQRIYSLFLIIPGMATFLGLSWQYATVDMQQLNIVSNMIDMVGMAIGIATMTIGFASWSGWWIRIPVKEVYRIYAEKRKKEIEENIAGWFNAIDYIVGK